MNGYRLPHAVRYARGWSCAMGYTPHRRLEEIIRE
jgi:hypothetical protein